MRKIVTIIGSFLLIALLMMSSFLIGIYSEKKEQSIKTAAAISTTSILNESITPTQEIETTAIEEPDYRSSEFEDILIEDTGRSQGENLRLLNKLISATTTIYTEQQFDLFEKHIVGKWKFAERVVKIDPYEQYTSDYNFSDKGVQELIQNGGIYYNIGMDSMNSFVRFSPFLEFKNEDKNFFSNAQDAFLYSRNGGGCNLRTIIFKENYIDIALIAYTKDDSIPNNQKNNKIALEVDKFKSYICLKTLVENFAPNPIDFTNEYSHMNRIYTSVFGNNLFIDPNDTNSLYVDFGGLWRLERADNN